MQKFLSKIELRSTLQGFALCDAILMPDWELRYYSFNIVWNLSAKEEMGSIRNGEGMEAFFLFSPNGVAGKILNDKLVSNVKKILKNIPKGFSNFKIEPAFSLQNVSYYMWKEDADIFWQISPEENWSMEGLELLMGGIEAYHSWAEAYYCKKIDLSALVQVFTLKKIDNVLLQKLNCERSFDEIQEDFAEIVG